MTPQATPPTESLPQQTTPWAAPMTPQATPPTESLPQQTTPWAATTTVNAPMAENMWAVAPDPEPVPAVGGRGLAAVTFARAQTGKPCVWGATGPDSYDSSSLIRAAWRAAGVDLPRTAQDQARAGTPVSLTNLQPGDLVFFHADARHVGLFTGDGMMVHAPAPGAVIREEPVFATGEAAVHSAVRPA
ncbi:hypothetical protein FNH04_26040 [Streptomyces phyllanthi]|uniref:NlpC/P60 domain-containing protein n=2 Tax=Streptomyces phyllanthi TaxID=1803180 RepID=A0A5N8W8T7_9ACTN|nr:hypothetical protein [Streptomyces phyllanthi]